MIGGYHIQGVDRASAYSLQMLICLDITIEVTTSVRNGTSRASTRAFAAKRNALNAKIAKDFLLLTNLTKNTKNLASKVLNVKIAKNVLQLTNNVKDTRNPV
jgi:hypothetical protein